MLVIVPGTAENLLLMFWITVVGVSQPRWRSIPLLSVSLHLHQDLI